MMTRPRATVQFPDPKGANPDGLVAVGGELTTGNLYEAYSRGIFPWPQEGLPLLWFSPDPRGVLHFSDLHLSRSLLKEEKRGGFSFTVNQAFEQVVEFCAAQPRHGQDGTWIIPEMKKAYTDFHKEGHAHSIECWQEGELVGGLYGVFVEGVFSGESMFYRASGASKLSLVFLIEHLRSLGLEWMDTQMVTPVLGQMGAKNLGRAKFLGLLEQSQTRFGSIAFL